MYKKASYGWLRYWDFLLLDLIVMQLAFRAAYAFCLPPAAYSDRMYRNELVMLMFCQIAAAFFISPYQDIMKRSSYIEFRESLKHVCAVMLLAVLHLFLTRQTLDHSRLLFTSTAAIYLVLLYLSRIIRKMYLVKKGRSSVGSHSMVVITVSALADELISRFTGVPYEGFTISGIVLLDQDLTGQYIGEIPVVACAESVKDYIRHEWVDEVFIKIPNTVEYPGKLIDSFILMGITVHMTLSKIENIQEGIQQVELMGGETVLTTSISMVSPKQRLYKRMMDIAGGLIGCLITAFLFLFIGPAIYISSPGPILFKQVRIGQNGRQFKLYKFRSMYMDAERQKQELIEQNKMQGSPLMFKMDCDPRVIGSGKKDRHGNPKGIGHFIRRTSLDEFPQFWNVLKGEMSLVGTRPPTVDEWELYDLHHRIRMAIKPGITGMWQVSGRSKITDFDEVVRLDTEYIKNWSLGLDCTILLKTLCVIYSRDGAT